MKIVALSDLHGNLPKNINKCDLVIIAGDIVPLEIQDDELKSISWFILDFKPWADSLPCDKVIFIAGNHDFMIEKYSKTAKYFMTSILYHHHRDTKLVYLKDSSFEYEGIRFYGTPWVCNLKNWAFYADKKTLIEKFSNMPKKFDVLITHCPPTIGLVGTVLENNNMSNYGSVELERVIDTRDFKWCICGHVHSGNHNPENIEGKTYVNVSLLNENYKVAYEPFEFEI